MPDATGSVDLGGARTPEEEEALRALQAGEKPAEDPEAQDVLHTFLVVVDLDGNPRPIPVDHPLFKSRIQSTPDLMYGAAATMMKDFAAVEAAQTTAGIMAQQAQMIQEQMRNQMVAQKIAAEGGVRR